ncbi:FtsX-like permease family protein [Amycolatopsis rhizosphaerae]|uniref:FtsX-like permease family protein n=1 Tax=Amycolatopsis rhizosphaerae TaxID=2053003 RepID=A0A558B4V3_9PSEU|nr:ABC transporter permease [Amycolatopsis rhizosphaerae]TVT31539.1 FtsX-like permease family protein [Amycolatopsis rhizosphaerae]
MMAVWQASRGMVRRRRLQTTVIGIVILAASATIVVALGLLSVASSAFDRIYSAQNGAHLSLTFDAAKVSAPQLAQTAARPGVEAAAGPFGVVTLDTSDTGYAYLGRLTVAGRPDPGGPVDRLNLWQGRWPAAPGEIVLNRPPGEAGLVPVGDRIVLPGRPTLTVVGFALSLGNTADAWVTPDQLTALGPAGWRMLYRFTTAATAADLAADQSTVLAGLPAGSLRESQSYLAVRAKISATPQAFAPFLVFFGILALAVAALIVTNVVSGAVITGFRHIGVLKAIGFTPNQVLAVHLVMVSVPTLAGTALGTVCGDMIASPVLGHAFEAFGPVEIDVAGWVNVVVLLGMPALVALAAILPALRARRLSATEAISSGRRRGTGRGLRVQRWLSGSRLPRPVSLGVGLLFARPGRTALTLAAVVLGVTTTTLAIGLASSITTYQSAARPDTGDRLFVAAAGLAPVPVDGKGFQPEQVEAALTDSGDEAMLRGLPGTRRLAAVLHLPVSVPGVSQDLQISFYRGDSADLSPSLLAGHWPDGPGQVAASGRFLAEHGLSVGDPLTVVTTAHRAEFRIAGEVIAGNDDQLLADWTSAALLAPGERADIFVVQLARGTAPRAFVAAVRAGDPGLRLLPTLSGDHNTEFLVIGSVTLLTLILGAVTALGVFNTVVLNTRERRRDLAMLKSIGMTPRQVTLMMVCSMAALGVAAGVLGLPLGVGAHRLMVLEMLHAIQRDVPDLFLDVYSAPTLVLLGLAGIVIAVLGAFFPARAASAAPVAEALHDE